VQALVGVNWVEDPYRGAAVYLDTAGRVMRIEEKPPRGTAATHWNNAGLFVFDPVILGYAARLQSSPRGERELPDAITAMIADGYVVLGLPLEGAWRDVGTQQDYMAINAEFGEASSP
jgi:dTDP-glucose pyrophosphorylase